MASQVKTHSEQPATTHEKAPFPPFDTSTYASQFFWLVVIFAGLYIILSRFALPRVGSILEERNDRIFGDKDEAARLTQESEEAKKAYEEALAQSRRQAQTLITENNQKLQEKLDKKRAEMDASIAAKVAESEKRIAEIQTHAAAEIKEIAEKTVPELVELLVAQKPDEAAVKSAVNEVSQ